MSGITLASLERHMISDLRISRLADWDDDDPSALPDTSTRWDKVVVLKQMFTLVRIPSLWSNHLGLGSYYCPLSRFVRLRYALIRRHLERA